MSLRLPTILAIDDVQVNLILLETFLENCNCQLITKSKPKEALNQIETILPDIVLLDLIMPEMHGKDVAKWIKSNSKTKHIPVVAFTIEEKETGEKKEYFDGFLYKPFTMESLINTLEKFIPGFIYNLENTSQANEKQSQIKEQFSPAAQLKYIDIKNVKPIQFGGATVLAVDDLPVNLLLLESYLDEHDINFISKTSAHDAIQCLAETKPDLILMDIRMPEMNGRDAAKIIRSNPDTMQIPIIAFTASEEEQIKVANEKLFDGVLGKPYTKDQLMEALILYLKKK